MNEQGRFHDNSSGVISDTKYNMHWLPKDSWGDLGQWRTYDSAIAYANLMNQVYAGGFSDWRLPSKEEAENFYDTSLNQIDWEEEVVHIDKLFVTKCANFINLFPIFFKEKNNKGYLETYKKYYWWNDMNFNIEGNKLVAREITKILK